MFKARRSVYFILGSVAVIVGCNKSSSSSSSSKLTSMSNLLALPLAGQAAATSRSFRGFSVTRSTSRSGCETVAATARLQNGVQAAKLLLCIFGALDAKKLISQASSGYNYYNLSTSGKSFNFRYGTLNGNLHVNGCKSSVQVMEADDQEGNSTDTVTVVSPFVALAGPQLMQTTILTDSKMTMTSATAISSGVATGSFSLTAGTPDKLSEYWSTASETIQAFAEFDSSQGTCNLEVNTGSPSTMVDTWTNDKSYSCVSPSSSGTYYTDTNAFNLTTITAPTGSPAYMDSWSTCAPPDGTTASTITISDLTVAAAIDECITTDDVVTSEPDCSSLSSACP